MLAYHCHLLTYKWNITNGGTFVYCFAKQFYFLFQKFSYGVKVENCNLIVRCIDYFQRSSPVFAMQAFGNVCLKLAEYYTRELLFFPINSTEKSACILYSSAYYMRDFMVVIYSKCTSKPYKCLQDIAIVQTGTKSLLFYTSFHLTTPWEKQLQISSQSFFQLRWSNRFWKNATFEHPCALQTDRRTCHLHIIIINRSLSVTLLFLWVSAKLFCFELSKALTWGHLHSTAFTM